MKTPFASFRAYLVNVSCGPRFWKLSWVFARIPIGIRLRNHCVNVAQRTLGYIPPCQINPNLLNCNYCLSKHIKNISGFCKLGGLSRAYNLFLPSYNLMYFGLPWDPSHWYEASRYGTLEWQGQPKLIKLWPDCVQGMFRSPLRSPPAFTSRLWSQELGDPCGANLI